MSDTPVSTPSGVPTLYEADRLFDGTAFVEPPRVLIAEGRIAAVGADTGPLGGGTEHVAVGLGDVTLLPGLVDCHQHLVFDGNGTLEEQVAGHSDEALLERAGMHARRALEGGVTTLRDLGDRNFVTLGLRGEPGLPTILCAGPPITLERGHCWYLGGECSRRDGLRRAVRDRVERGCDVVKIMVTGGFGTPALPPWQSQFTADDLRVMVEEAHRAGLPVAAHCHGHQGISDAIDAGVDTIEHCTFLTGGMTAQPDIELLERLAGSGIVLSATFGRCPDSPPPPPQISALTPQVRAAQAVVRELRGRIVVGSDAGINPSKPHDVAPHAIHDLLTIGMTPTEALGAMTSGGADALGLPAKGRLVPGADADMIAVRGDPTVRPEALAAIVEVWSAGVSVLSDQAPAHRNGRT